MIKYFIIAIGVLLLLLSGMTWLMLDARDKYKIAEANADSYLALKNETEEKVRKANEISEKFQVELSTLDKQLANLRLQYKANSRVRVSTSECRPDARPAIKVLPNGNGGGDLPADWLFDFAARCEKSRLKVLGFQEFHKNTEE